jgi:hypothetical protein
MIRRMIMRVFHGDQRLGAAVQSINGLNPKAAAEFTSGFV